jgi:thioredoxin-related protein
METDFFFGKHQLSCDFYRLIRTLLMDKMKKLILNLFVMMMASPLFSQTEDAPQLEIGVKAPLTEYPLYDLEGKQVTLKSQLKANGLIVVFSCNTCPFVVGSDKFEGWERMYNELAAYAAQNEIGFILVNSNEAKRDGDDSVEEMRKHAAELGYTMPYLVDHGSKLANAFAAKTTPHVFMMDGKMKLVYKGSIDNSWDSSRKVDIPYLKQAIQELSLGQTISFSETPPKGCSIKRN